MPAGAGWTRAQRRVMQHDVHRFLVSMMLAAVLALAPGCFGERPADMLEIAQFEELQRNYPHAREIYTRILAKFPDSPEASVARERLDALDAADTESP